LGATTPEILLLKLVRTGLKVKRTIVGVILRRRSDASSGIVDPVWNAQARGGLGSYVHVSLFGTQPLDGW
jgi:hypothetical protein